jgi:two-component system, OmpR family, response regulator
MTAGEPTQQLLLVEDDVPLADALARALRGAGYGVEVAATVVAALAVLAKVEPDLVILDLGLPDLDGSEVVRHLAQLGCNTPVLVLSARDGLDERVRLLNLGADDYLVKPAVLDEFQARVRAALRRRRAGPPARLSLGRLSLDIEGCRAFVDGQPLDLNGREWALLHLLATRPNHVVSREDIVAALYGAGEPVSINAVEQILSRFRKRLGNDVLPLRTVRGLGYYLDIADGA